VTRFHYRRNRREVGVAELDARGRFRLELGQVELDITLEGARAAAVAAPSDFRLEERP